MFDIKNDLQIDPSRCLRMRFNESSCRQCIDICPRHAVSLDDGLAINSTDCSGCMLCTSVCPSGALEQSLDFATCLAQLSRVPNPVLGCSRTSQCSNATIACLGGLSEEHLVAFCYSLTGKLQLNLLACGDCPNSTSISVLRKRLKELGQADFSFNRIAAVDSIHELDFSDESVGRRGFFKSLRNSLFQSAAVILSSSNEQAERRTEYAGKRLPLRRELLNQIKNRLPPDSTRLILSRFEHHLSFSDKCTACQGCVAICPTGALQTDSSDSSPAFDSDRCTGCGLCVEFCFDGALGFEES